jgi:hypothetical protein
VGYLKINKHNECSKEREREDRSPSFQVGDISRAINAAFVAVLYIVIENTVIGTGAPPHEPTKQPGYGASRGNLPGPGMSA